MKHAREDYDRFQDPEHKIPEDEPVFLIRAQDVVGPMVVQVWARLAKNAGAAPDIVAAARKQAKAMTEWQEAHGSKIPDMPHTPRRST